MQQSKLTQKSGHRDTARLFFDDLNRTPRKKVIENVETIEPWMEQTEKNPFIMFHSEQKQKIQRQKRKNISFKLIKASNQKVTEKMNIVREYKVLPIKDVGNINTIRRTNYLKLTKKEETSQEFSPKKNIKPHRKSMSTLPLVSRELSIERKLFLMKNGGTLQKIKSSSFILKNKAKK